MAFVLFCAYTRDAVYQRVAAQSGAGTPVTGPAQQNNVPFSPLNQGVNTWWYGDFF